ncbi:extracellular solute-binding protein [Paenibacillus sp. MBLB4367]|uniref:extracellular solute-binding protein n=1 Tax=Paenibacillus sp. MBLB4367 TaxID=3384767 RepID=UPI00390818C9
MKNKIFLLLLATSLLAAGCEKQPEAASKPAVSGKLKTSQTKQQYYRDYGDLIDTKFPELEMEFADETLNNPSISLQSAVIDSIDKEQADIVSFVGIDMYENMVKSGKILDLEPYIARDRFELSGFLPSVTDLLRDKGNGKLYGLSVRFFSSALAFNKSLFDQKKIPYPTDRMSWTDVMNVAGQFAQEGGGEQRNIGFFTSKNVFVSPSSYVTMIGKTNGLSLIDAEAKELLLGSPEWRNVIRLIVDAYAKGALLPPEEAKAYTNQEVNALSESSDLFKAGRAAMTLTSTDLINKMKAMELMFDVGFVTAPVDPQMSDGTIHVSPATIFAIDARSQNPDTAWEIIKFVVSDQVARITERNTNTSQFTTRIHVLDKETAGTSLEPFYKQPKLDSRSTIGKMNPKLRPDFERKLFGLIDRELIAVYKGEQTTDEAVASILKQGQPLLSR